MSFNFSSENNEFNEPSNDNSNNKNNSENLIGQASQEELESKIKDISNQLNMPIFADQMTSENHKIFEVTTNYDKEGDNPEGKYNDIGQSTGNYTKETQVVEKLTSNGNNKTITTTTTTIIRNKPKIMTTENIKFGFNDYNINNNNNENENNKLPILSEKIVFADDKINSAAQNNEEDNNNQANTIKTHKKEIEVLIDSNNEQFNNNQNNDINFGQKYIEFDDDENNNNFGASNNIISNSEINQNINSINFGAPKDNNPNNYIPLSTNITFGFKNNENTNTNIINNNNVNDSNVSSSVDKSSEVNELNLNVKFGFIPNNKENIDTPKKNKFALDSNNIKFGFFDSNDKNNQNDIIDEQNNQYNQDEMDIEPGEIKEDIKMDKINENEDIKVIIKEDNKEEENDIKEEKKDQKTDEKKDESDKKEVKKEIIFDKSLFDEQQGQDNNSFFNQKLFQNNKNEQNENKNKSLFGGLFDNNNINIFNSGFDNKKTEEMFLKNNNVSNIFSPFSSNGKEEIKSQDKSLFESKIEENKPTLNEIITKDVNIEEKKYQSPLTAYINQNVGKNFIIGDKKDNKDNNITINTNTTNSININMNPFLSVISNINDENKKQENNTNANNALNQNKSQNEIKNSFSIFDSTGNLEKVYSTLDDNKNKSNNNDEIKEENKDKNNNITSQNIIFGQNQSNFFTNNPETNTENIEQKKITTSSLFPGLGLQKPKSEKSKPIKSPLFPGLNNTKPSDQPIIDENKNKPLFPGNLEIKKNKSSLFGSDIENKGLFNIKEEISVSKNSKNDDEEKNEKGNPMNDNAEEKEEENNKNEEMQENILPTLDNVIKMDNMDLVLNAQNEDGNQMNDDNKVNVEPDEIEIEINLDDNNNKQKEEQKQDKVKMLENILLNNNEDNKEEIKNLIEKEIKKEENKSQGLFSFLNNNNEKKQKKSLFDGLFDNNNNEQGFDLLFNKSKSFSFLNDSNNNNNLFSKSNEGLFSINFNNGLFVEKKEEDKNGKGSNIDQGLFADRNNKENEKENMEKKNRNMNIISNNDGKSLFEGLNENGSKNLKFFGAEITPIKSSSFFNQENNKENIEKEKLEKEKLEKERLEKERLENERIENERIENERREKEILEKERIEKERLEKERIDNERLEIERLEKEKLEKERIEKEMLDRINKEKEENEKNDNEQNIVIQETLEMELDGNNEEQNKDEKENLISSGMNKEKEHSDKEGNEKEDLPEEQEENNIINRKNINENEEEQEEIEVEEIVEKKTSEEKNDLPQETINIRNEIKNEELEYSSDDEDEEEELSSEEEEYVDKNKEPNITSSEDGNKNIIKIRYSQRKPLKKEIYSNLLQKMIDMTNKRKNRINEKENNQPTIHINNLNEYMKELEDKLILMKKGYIETLVEKHFVKNKDKKKEIIIKANIPKKRNEVKRIFKKLMGYIKDKLELPNQKYYYILILNILKKYKNINKDEMMEEIQLYKKQKSIRKIKKSGENKEKIKDNYDDYNWIIQQNKKKGMGFYIFSIIIPLAYVINFVFSNSKA